MKIDWLIIVSIAIALSVSAGILAYGFPYWLQEVGPSGIITIGLVSAIFENVVIVSLVFGLVAYVLRRAADRRKEDEARRERLRQDLVEREAAARKERDEERKREEAAANLAQARRMEAQRKAIAEQSIRSSTATFRAAAITAASIDIMMKKIMEIIHSLSREDGGGDLQKMRRKVYLLAVELNHDIDLLLSGHEFKANILSDVLLDGELDALDDLVRGQEIMQRLRWMVQTFSEAMKVLALDRTDIRNALEICVDMVEASTGRLEQVANQLQFQKVETNKDASVAVKQLVSGMRGLIKKIRVDLEKLPQPAGLQLDRAQ